MSHDLSDPVTVASVIVRDHLDTVMRRHKQFAVSTDPRTDPRDKAVSEAVLRLATALLEHLPGEAKQARVDRKPEGSCHE